MTNTLSVDYTTSVTEKQDEIVMNELSHQNDDSESIVIEKPISSGSRISEYLYSETRNNIKKGVDVAPVTGNNVKKGVDVAPVTGNPVTMGLVRMNLPDEPKQAQISGVFANGGAVCFFLLVLIIVFANGGAVYSPLTWVEH